MNKKEKEIREFINQLCRYAGEDAAFADDFYERLRAEEEVLEEFIFYMEHGNFACKAQVQGYTVVDVMVFQIDHFKAWLDRDTNGTGRNGDRMLLLAFDTLLKMKKEPEKYIRQMQTQTGTDYEGKYQ